MSFTIRDPADTPSAMLAAGRASTSRALNAVDPSDSEQLPKLLAQAKTAAYQLREDASAMESYSRWSTDSDNHEDMLDDMRDHIDAARRILAKLDDTHACASPSQMSAIERIKPLLTEIASNSEAVMQAINKNPKRLIMQEYKVYIEANYDEAGQLADLIADFVNYGNSANRTERPANKLELPVSQRA